MTYMLPSEPPESANIEKSDCASSEAYPSWYASEFQARDGVRFTVRPIRPDDEPLMVDFAAGFDFDCDGGHKDISGH